MLFAKWKGLASLVSNIVSWVGVTGGYTTCRYCHILTRSDLMRILIPEQTYFNYPRRDGNNGSNL